ETENTRAGSPLSGKIALDKVAVMGQSCGGFLALELGADPRVDTIGMFNSGAHGNAADVVAELHPAWAAIRVEDSALGARYRRVMRHRGHKKAVGGGGARHAPDHLPSLGRGRDVPSRLLRPSSR